MVLYIAIIFADIEYKDIFEVFEEVFGADYYFYYDSFKTYRRFFGRFLGTYIFFHYLDETNRKSIYRAYSRRQ